MAVFVPFVLPGEKIEADVRQEKPGFARGSLTRVVEPSPDRVVARCPYFRACGGCHYQHIPYARQLDFKAEILQETLQRVGKIELKSDLRVHASDPWNYRNRTRLQVRTSPEFELGYFRLASHDFLPVQECPISSPLLNRILQSLLVLRGLNCPSALEELELFADAADSYLLAWGFCSQGSDPKSLVLWADTLRRELPEIIGFAFFPSRRRRADDDSPADPKNNCTVRRQSDSLPRERPRLPS